MIPMIPMIPVIQAIQAVILLMVLAPQQPFTQFTYCRANSTGSLESVCIQLDSSGTGEARFKRRDADEMKFAIALSPGGNSQFLTVLSGTRFLANAKEYESKKKVADIGKKHLTLEMGAERREAEFNFSELKDVNALVTFFEKLVTQELIVIDLEWAMKFDSLGIPERLDQLEQVLKAGRVADPKSLMDVLALISRDEHIMNYARSHAREMSERIGAAK
jgi:hypothetical protein